MFSSTTRTGSAWIMETPWRAWRRAWSPGGSADQPACHSLSVYGPYTSVIP